MQQSPSLIGIIGNCDRPLLAKRQETANTFPLRYPRFSRNLPLVKGCFGEHSSRSNGCFCGRLDGWK